jgi:hypothetical protein
MLWISGAVLVAGIGVFLGIFLSHGTGQAAISDPATISSPSVRTPSTNVAPVKKVPPAPAALRVARLFLETAVPRKNLDAAYDIVGPALKGGYSRAQWRIDAIPVTYYPASNLKTAPLDVISSTKNHLLLQVGLKTAPHSGVAPSVKALGFQLQVDRIRGKWLVNYFSPIYKPGVLPGQNLGN